MIQTKLFDLDLAEKKASEGMHNAYTSETKTAHIERIILELVHNQGFVTSDCLRRRLIKDKIEVKRSNAIGPAFRILSDRGLIVTNGITVKSYVVSSHARSIRMWFKPCINWRNDALYYVDKYNKKSKKIK